MAKSFVSKFKEDFQFLEEYGFVFSRDPQNPNRPCYKNHQFEVVMWISNASTLFDYKELYIQVNGWKKHINFKEEYFKCFGVKPRFKKIEKIFKELFIFVVERYKEFFGLEVNKNIQVDNQDDYMELLELEKEYNVNSVIKNGRTKTILLFLGAILFFLKAINLLIPRIFFVPRAIYTLDSINVWLVLIISLIIIIGMYKILSKLSILLLMVYPVLVVISHYYIPKRYDYIIYLIGFLVTLLYLLVSMVIKLITKNNLHLRSSALAFCYPLMIGFYKAIELQKYIFFEDIKLNGLFKIGLIIGVVSFLLFLILLIIKVIKVKKRSILGVLVCSFLVPILLIVIVPTITISSINYMFDASISTKVTYQIYDKKIKVGTGRYSSTNYYLVINKDGFLEEISVSQVLYAKYGKTYYIDLYKHDGFLGYEYYEYKE